MNQKVYNKVCRKVGHDWAVKDCETFMLKVCLNCGCEQCFFSEEVDWYADMDHDDSEENRNPSNDMAMAGMGPNHRDKRMLKETPFLHS